MESKTPTLEEIAEKYKNALEIKNAYGNKNIKKPLKLRYSEDKSFIYCWDNVIVFWDNGVYAKIISYKEETPKTDSMVDSVVNQFKERSKRGIEKYGTTLQENNTDDFLQHFKEELMDAILYIQKLQSQRNDN